MIGVAYQLGTANVQTDATDIGFVTDVRRMYFHGDRVAKRFGCDQGLVGLVEVEMGTPMKKIIYDIGGGVAGAGELILGPARVSMRAMLMDEILAEVRVVPAELGNNASLAGAAMMALERCG